LPETDRREAWALLFAEARIEMNRGPIILVEELRRVGCFPNRKPSAKLEDSAVPWTFNQILLPLILILTFVILTHLVEYKREYDEMVEAIRDKDPILEPKIAVLNLQLQKLLRALEEVKGEIREETRAAVFVQPGRIVRRGSRIEDEEFQKFCRETLNLASGQGYRSMAGRIYKSVLERTGILDPSSAGYTVQRSKLVKIEDLTEEKVRSMPDSEWARVYAAKEGRISPRNRQILQNAILDFCDGLLRQAISVESQLIDRLREEALANPQSLILSATARKIVNDLFDPARSAEDRKRLARDFYWNLVEEWKKRFDEDGYPMLVWRILKV
jgi:hypothetical protein